MINKIKNKVPIIINTFDLLMLKTKFTLTLGTKQISMKKGSLLPPFISKEVLVVFIKISRHKEEGYNFRNTEGIKRRCKLKIHKQTFKLKIIQSLLKI